MNITKNIYKYKKITWFIISARNCQCTIQNVKGLHMFFPRGVGGTGKFVLDRNLLDTPAIWGKNVDSQLSRAPTGRRLSVNVLTIHRLLHLSIEHGKQHCFIGDMQNESEKYYMLCVLEANIYN